MNIWLVSEEYPPETGWGGIASYLALIASELAARNNNVNVISRSVGPEKKVSIENGVKVIRLLSPDPLSADPSIVPAPLKPLLSRLPLLTKEIRERLAFIIAVRRELFAHFQADTKPDIVEVPDWGAAGLAFVGGFAKPIKYIVRLHTPTGWVEKANNTPTLARNHILHKLEALTLKRASMISSPSRILADMAIKEYSLNFQRVSVIKYPINSAFWDGDKNSPPPAKEDFIFYAGRLEARKGVIDLIDAFKIVAKGHPEVKLLLAGSDTPTGPAGTSYEAMLYKRIAALGISGRVDFVGNKNKEELKQLYRKAKAVVVPSRFDNSPHTVSEAQSAGSCVIATNVGGISELITDNEDGLLVPPASSGALALALDRVLKDEKLRRRLAFRGKRRVALEQSPALIAKQTEELFQQAIYFV